MPPSGSPAALRIPLHYDFASTLCYVAHRSLPRLAQDLRRLDLHFDWSPLDLARLLGWRRGATVAGPRRENALRVARELGIEVRMPAQWTDSRRALAVGLALGAGPREEAWRERVFSAVFEEGRPIDSGDDLAPLLRELRLELDPRELDAELDQLAARTERARDAEVSGVPTFMLGAWPLGGIQTDETMRLILERWARRQRSPD